MCSGEADAAQMRVRGDGGTLRCDLHCAPSLLNSVPFIYVVRGAWCVVLVTICLGRCPSTMRNFRTAPGMYPRNGVLTRLAISAAAW
jgi:hypothetical protein